MPEVFATRPENPSTDDRWIMPGSDLRPPIQNDWALYMDWEHDDPADLRTAAAIIMKEWAGITSLDGRIFSGREQRAMDPREYYKLAVGAFKAGSLTSLFSPEWMEFHEAEGRGDKAAMRALAAKNIRGEGVAAAVGAAVDKHVHNSTAAELEEMRRSLGAVRDAMTPDDLETLDHPYRLGMGYVQGVTDLYKKYHGTIEDERRLDAYRKQLADENQWAVIESIKGHVTENARNVLEMALESADDPTNRTVMEAFGKLSTPEMRSIAGALQALHYDRDPNFKALCADAGRAFMNTLESVTAGAVRGATDLLQRTWMDGAEYRDMVDRRVLLEDANRERMADWGIVGNAVIGAASTIPYMAAAAVPYVGMADMILTARDEFQSQAARNGVDVSSPDFILGSSAFAIAYAYVEKIQWEKAFGGIANLSRRQMYCDVFHSVRAALGVAGAFAGTVLTESGEEGIQAALEEAATHWGQGTTLADEIKAFTEDFVGSLGTMAIIGAFGGAKQGLAYRHGALGFDVADALASQSRILELDRHMAGHPGEVGPLADYGRTYGRMVEDWLNAGTDVDRRQSSLMRWGLTKEQATAIHGALQNIWTSIEGSDASAERKAEQKSALVGGGHVLTPGEMIARIQNGGYLGKVEQLADGSQAVNMDIAGTTLRMVVQPKREASRIDENDSALFESIVNELNSRNILDADGAKFTVERWTNLTPEQRRDIIETNELYNQGYALFYDMDGNRLDGRVLDAITGNVHMTDVALPQTAFHETMHGVLRLLTNMARGEKAGDGGWKVEPDPAAAALVGELAEIFPALSEREAVNEEALANAFQAYMTDRVGAVEHTGLLDRLGRFLARLFGYGGHTYEIGNARTAHQRLFNTAITGHIAQAVQEAAGEAEAAGRAEVRTETEPVAQAEPGAEGEAPDAPTPTAAGGAEAVLRLMEADYPELAPLAVMFRNGDPLVHEQMASLVKATGGRLDTDLVWAAGYRWNGVQERWEHDERLERPVDERDRPQQPYMGADGELQEAEDERRGAIQGMGTPRGIFSTRIDTKNRKTADGYNTVIFRRPPGESAALLAKAPTIDARGAQLPTLPSGAEIGGRYTDEDKKALRAWVEQTVATMRGEIETLEFGTVRIGNRLADEFQMHGIRSREELESLTKAPEILKGLVHFAASPNEDVSDKAKRSGRQDFFEYGLARVTLSDGNYLVLGEIGIAPDGGKYYDQRLVGKIANAGSKSEPSPVHGRVGSETLPAFDGPIDNRFRILLQAKSEFDARAGTGRASISTRLPSPEFAMDGTIVDALPAHLREDARAIVAERGGTAAWMVEADGTPTELREREWLRREAERRHGAGRFDGQQRYSIHSTLATGRDSTATYTDSQGVERTLIVERGTRKHGMLKVANKHCVDYGTAWTGGFTLEEMRRYERKILSEGKRSFNKHTGSLTFKWKSPEGVTFTIGAYVKGKGKKARDVVNTVYTDRTWHQTKMLGTNVRGQVRNSQPSAGKMPRPGQNGKGERRYQISGLYTGSAADYAQRDENGNIVNGPSLQHIGSGEGSQVYGWGLYGSTVRGVAEVYANPSGKISEVLVNGERHKAVGVYEKVASMLKHGDAKQYIKDTLEAVEEMQRALDESGKSSVMYGVRRIDQKYIDRIKAEIEEARRIIDSGATLAKPGNLYEQTFFTNRSTPEETERHLLKWFEPVSEEQRQWIASALKEELAKNGDNIYSHKAVENLIFDLQDGETTTGDQITGESLYRRLQSENALGDAQAASEFLARAGIDGVKYPVNSYGGKSIKDGDTAGWNYVSFRDDNIRVDHKWVDEEQRYQIAGRAGAERLGIRGLGDAEAMERSGATREDIWRETGWWRGADGKWRVEIPDFTLSMETLDREAYGNDPDYFVRKRKLPDLIGDTRLFDAYPHLRRVTVQTPHSDQFGGVNTYGDFNNGTRIRLNMSAMQFNPDEVRATLAHEIQHAIQAQEGLAQGGNAGQFKPVDVAKMRQKAKAERKRGNVAEADRLETEADELEENALDGMVVVDNQGYMDEFEAYQSLAGEVEARNVEKRLKMTPEERAATPPWETEDVEEGRQIVRFSVSPAALETAVTSLLSSGKIDVRFSEEERQAAIAAAKDFHSRYGEMRIPLSTGGVMFFAPSKEAIARHGGDEAAAWAEYALHAVTNDNVDKDRKHYRAFAKEKIEKVLPRIPEIVAADRTIIDRGRAVYFMGIDEKHVARLVAKPENGNLRADNLVEVTATYTGNKNIPDTLRPLVRAVAAWTSRGDSTNSETVGFSEAHSAGEVNGENGRRGSVAGTAPGWWDVAGQAEAAAQEGRELARHGLSFGGPAFSHRSYVEAFAARDRALGFKRSDEDYKRLIDAFGLTGKMTVADAKAAGEALQAEMHGAAATVAELAKQAEKKNFRKTVDRLFTGAAGYGIEVGANARQAWAEYVARMRRLAKGRNAKNMAADAGLVFWELLLAAGPEGFEAQEKGKPQGGGKATDADDEEAALTAALIDGREGELGYTPEAAKARLAELLEAKKGDAAARNARLKARLEEWRKQEAERLAALQARQEAEAARQAEAGEKDGAADGEGKGKGDKPQESEEEEAVAEMPDFRAFIQALQEDGWDLANPGEFAAVLRFYVEDWLAEKNGIAPGDVMKDPVAAAEYRATVQEILRDSCNQLLDPNDGAAVRIAERMLGEIPGDASAAEIEARSRSIIGFIKRNAIRQSRKKLVAAIIEDIKKLAIQGKMFDETEKDIGRKITGEREPYASYVARILLWGDKRIAAEMQRLNDIISGRLDAYRAARAEDAALEDLQRTDREIHRATERLAALQLWGGLRKKSPAEIALAGQQIHQWLETERDAHEKRWTEWKGRNDAMAAALEKAFTADRRDYTPDDPGLVGKAAEELTTNFRMRLERLAAGSGAEGRRAIDQVMMLIYAGSERLGALNAARRQRTDAMLERCVEGTGMKVGDFLKSLDEPIPEALNRELATEEQPVRMTWGQALQLLGELEQTASYSMNIAENGRTGHRELILEALAGKPQMLRLLEEMRRIYEEDRTTLSDEFFAVTGNPILSPDPLYLPARMFTGARDSLETTVRAWNPFGPAFTPRISNKRDFDLSASIMDVYNARMKETATALAFGMRGMELRSILARKSVQEAIARTHGKYALRKMIAQLTDIVSDGYKGDGGQMEWSRRAIRALGDITTYSALSWNAVTMLKQMTSIPAWTALLDGGYGEIFRHITNFDAEAARELCRSPGFVARYGATGFGKMFRQELENPQGGNVVARLFKAGMTAVQMGDFVPGILVGTGVYKARKLALLRKGLAEPAAREQAARETWGLIEENQQSSRLENTPEILRRGGFIGRQLSKFATSPMMQVAHEIHTLRMWLAEARIEARHGGKESGAVKALMNAQGDDAVRWRKRFVNQLICNHVLMPAAMYAIATIFKACLGGEPPDKEEIYGDLLMQMVAGPWSRIFLIGALADQTGEWVARMAGGKPNVYSREDLAATQHLHKALAQVGRIGGDVADLDWASVRDDFVKMASSYNAPIRYAATAIQNAAGYDPAKARRERKREIARREAAAQ